MEPGRARTSGPGVPLLPLARWVGWVAPVRPTHGVLVLSCPSAALRVCSVLGHLAPVHRFACSVHCVVCAVSWATWLPFTSAPARCVVLRVRCPGPLGSCSPVRPLGVFLCVRGVLGHLAHVHWCACWVCCVACAVSSASWLLFTGVPARCVVLRVRCPGPLGSCSPVCPCGLLCCVCSVLGHLAPVHRCARSVGCVACAVSWATWLLFTDVPARCVVLCLRCSDPLGSCSPVCLLSAPQGVMLPLVYGTTASPLWLELRDHSAWQATPSWTVYRLACHRLLPWLRVTFPMVPDAARPGSDQWPWSTAPATGPVGRLGRPSASDPWGVGSFLSLGRPTCVQCPGPLGSCSPVCPLRALCCVCGVYGHLAPVYRCARWVCCVACVVSLATWILFTVAPARCVSLHARCPGPLGSCSPVRPLGVLCCACGVLGHLAPVHRCVRVVCRVVCAVFLGHLAPVHRCARSVCCVVRAVSWAPWLLFTAVPARCVASRVRYPGPLGSCSPVRPLHLLLCSCGVLGHLAPVHRCARSVSCFACAVSWATWLLFTGVPARCVVLRVPCPGPPGSCSPVCPLGVLFCVCDVLGLVAPVQRGARSVCCVACAVSWATWLLFSGVPTRCVVLRVRCPGPRGSCTMVRPLRPLLCLYVVLSHLAPVHRCARSVCCFACAVPWATWLLFTGVPARCVVFRVRCPGPPGSCSPLCPLGVLFSVCGVLGFVAPVQRCARSVCCVACAVSWATWLLFTGVPARCVVLRVRCPWPPGSCSPVCPLGVLCCVRGVLGHLAPVHRCARSVCCVACAVSWATWLPFTGVPARCVALCARCPGPLGSCSPVCPLRVLCCVRGVLGHLAPVHRCARPVCCAACALSWASWLLFTGVPAQWVVSRVRCPGPLGSCSPLCPLGVLCCVRGILGHLDSVHRCARSVCCAACALSWASWLLFTAVPAQWVASLVQCPWPLGSCSPVCPLRVLCCVCGVLGRLALVHRCARSVCCALGCVWGVAVRGVAAGRTRVHPDGGCS